MSLDQIVQVNITRETTAVEVAGFGIGLVLGTHKRFNELSKSYTDMTGVGADFTSTDPEYIACNQYFSQSPKPTTVMVGRRVTNDTAVITVASVQDNTDYTVTVNGTDFTIDSGGAATNLTIAAALVAAIDGGSEPVDATDNLDGTFDIDPDVAGVPYTLDVTPTLLTIAAYTTTQAIGDDLDDINADNSTWYGLAITDNLQADQLLAAAWAEANEKLLGLGSSEADIVDTTDAADTTSLAAQLKALSYARTYTNYSEDVAAYYPEFSTFAYTATRDPGSYTLKFKSLPGIPVSNLTPTQSTNARDKYANTYEPIAGVNILREGKVAEGEFIDIIIFVDWLKARIQEAVYGRLVNLAKIPFTDSGIAIIEGEIRAVLELGIVRGGIVEGGYTVTVPKAADVPTNDRINRFLPDVKFTAQLSGAIHAVKIDGVVSV